MYDTYDLIRPSDTKFEQEYHIKSYNDIEKSVDNLLDYSNIKEFDKSFYKKELIMILGNILTSTMLFDKRNIANIGYRYYFPNSTDPFWVLFTIWTL